MSAFLDTNIVVYAFDTADDASAWSTGGAAERPGHPNTDRSQPAERIQKLPGHSRSLL
jgi:hypothetical protein